MKEKNDMEQNKYIEVTIELGEAVKPHIWTAQNGQKMLTFQVAPRKNGADEKGRTHNVSIRYRAMDGNYYTLQGVKVAQPKQGIYIHNGHKIVIK